MDKGMFEELLESIREMGRYLRGEIPEDELEVVDYPSYRVISIRGKPEPPSPAADEDPAT